jgi:putative DNA primase/helicase
MTIFAFNKINPGIVTDTAISPAPPALTLGEPLVVPNLKPMCGTPFAVPELSTVRALSLVGGPGPFVIQRFPTTPEEAKKWLAARRGANDQPAQATDVSDFDADDPYIMKLTAQHSHLEYQSIDFAAAKQEPMEYVEEILAEILPDGFIENDEFVALNPHREDRNAGSFRFNLTSGLWADFASDDKGGDIISYVAFACDLNQAEAARKIQNIVAKIKDKGGNTPEIDRAAIKPRQDAQEQNLNFISKFPPSFSEANLRHETLGMPSRYWLYLDEDSDIRFVACRFDLPATGEHPAKKEFRQRTYWQNTDTGAKFYKFKDAPKPSILYHLPELQRNPQATVIVTEGEKAADAAGRVFTDCVTTTSPGGAKRAHGADWSELTGREVIIIPDADAAGDGYMHDVAKLLLSQGCKVKVIDSRAASQITQGDDDRDDPVEGWDVADAVEEWTDLEALRLMLLDHVSNYTPVAPEGAAATLETPRTGNNSNEHLTDLGNAHRLVRHCDGNIRYVHALKAWFIWTGERWERDANGEIYRLAHQTVEQMFQDSNRIEDEVQRTALRKFALSSEKRAAFENMVALAQNLPGIPLSHDKLDADPYLLGVKNGVVDLRTGKFRSARRDDFITKQANVIYEPYADCPNWNDFQHKIACEDADLVSFKKRVFGAVLSGLFIEALFIQHGAGANGKTSETETIAHIMGDYAGVADSQIMMAPHNHGGATPELVGLRGKRLTCINESAENDTLNEARVKYITTNGAISARNIYEGLITFNPTHKLLLATNHKPRIRGTDHGIWRRIHYIPYGHTFSGKDKIERFHEKVLLPESSGILNWMIEGCQEWLSSGCKLNPPKKVTEAAEDYRREQDTVAQFMEVHYPYRDPTLTVELELADLHYKYQSWMLTELGWKGLGRKRFSDELVRLGYRKGRNAANLTVFKGASGSSPNAPPEKVPF